MKIDKYIKDISDRLDSVSKNGNGHDNDSYKIDKYDDEYYLDQNQDPPRFLLYRQARAEKWQACGPHGPSDYENTITSEELEFSLKRKLRITPESRFQKEKHNWYWHESSYYNRGLEAYDGYGCNNGECIPSCRFYPEFGVIEDQEIIEEHIKAVETLRQQNRIVAPPPESELQRLAKVFD